MKNTALIVILASSWISFALSSDVQQDEAAPTPPVGTDPSASRPIFGETIQLFNGENLDNWTAYFINGSNDPGAAFRVEDGILKCAGQPIGYIRTKKQYTSYRMVVEWRFDPKAGGGNSGILMRLNGEDTVWPNSIEAQLNSRDAGDIWNIGDFPMKTDPKRISGRRTKKMAPTNEKALGEWNRYDITLDGEQLELKVNGLVQNTATECTKIKGFIALQSEGVAIEFRTVELQPIIGHE